jgi:hypothetical protein
MNLDRERQRLLQRDADWAALSSDGQEVDRILAGMHALKGKTALRAFGFVNV